LIETLVHSLLDFKPDPFDGVGNDPLEPLMMDPVIGPPVIFAKGVITVVATSIDAFKLLDELIDPIEFPPPAPTFTSGPTPTPWQTFTLGPTSTPSQSSTSTISVTPSLTPSPSLTPPYPGYPYIVPSQAIPNGGTSGSNTPYIMVTYMFNSVLGDVFEVEPVYLRNSTEHGVAQAKMYVEQLKQAARNGDLKGNYSKVGLDIPYNWNYYPFRFHLGYKYDWPGKFRSPLPGFPFVDLVANFAERGLILYWLEPNLDAIAALGYLLSQIEVPNRRLVKPPNWSPQPGYAYNSRIGFQIGCEQVLYIVGGAIIVLTIVEDIITLGAGTLDDAVTVSAGLWLIDLGTKSAQFVPVYAP
jgi:hypothetical protein